MNNDFMAWCDYCRRLVPLSQLYPIWDSYCFCAECAATITAKIQEPPSSLLTAPGADTGVS